MKSLIIAITLLFSSATLAQAVPENMLPEEFTTYVENEIDRGLDSDISIFSGYINKTYKQGTKIENVRVAMRFVHCSLLWRNIHEMLTAPSLLTHEMIESGIWRAIEAAKAHILKAGGDPARVETIMVPTLSQMSIATQDSTIDINSANIYTCTALDLAVYVDMQINGAPVWPPEEWQLEPIPSFDEIEPEPETEPEIGQKLPRYDS